MGQDGVSPATPGSRTEVPFSPRMENVLSSNSLFFPPERTTCIKAQPETDSFIFFLLCSEVTGTGRENLLPIGRESIFRRGSGGQIFSLKISFRTKCRGDSTFLTLGECQMRC